MLCEGFKDGEVGVGGVGGEGGEGGEEEGVVEADGMEAVGEG